MHLDPAELSPVVARLRRANGQLAAVVRMIEDEREVREIVTQLAAASKALDRAGFALVATALQTCMADSDDPANCAEIEDMEKLFLSLT